VVFSNTLFCCLAVIEFHKSITNFQFNIDYISNLAKAALEIFLASMLWQATNIDFVGL